MISSFERRRRLRKYSRNERINNTEVAIQKQTSYIKIDIFGGHVCGRLFILAALKYILLRTRHNILDIT